jgi:hypothetical protein
MTATPRTEAGKRLLTRPPKPCDCGLEHAILAIEAEAATLAAERSTGLDVAWAEAEAALPEGWRASLNSHPRSMDLAQRYVAVARPIYSDWSEGSPPDPIRLWADTPAAALRALAARLREEPR